MRRLGGRLFSCKQNHTPFDVVAWHGTFVALIFRYAVLSPCLLKIPQLCTLQIRDGEVRECWQHLQRSHRSFHLLRIDSEVEDTPPPSSRLLDFQPEMGRRESYVPTTILSSE